MFMNYYLSGEEYLGGGQPIDVKVLNDGSALTFLIILMAISLAASK